MVFCDEPWYNEPGRERQPNKGASDQYNRSVQEWTIQHAMLPWLNGSSVGKAAADPDTNYFWGEVVRRHFDANGKTIADTVRAWKNKAGKNGRLAPLTTELVDTMAKGGFVWLGLNSQRGTRVLQVFA